MKNLKNMIIYGTITLLCIAAFGTYQISKNNSRIAVSSGETSGISKTSGISDATESGSFIQSRTSDSAGETTARLLSDAEGNNYTDKSEEEKQKHITEIMSREFETLDPNPVVGIGQGSDFSRATADAIANAGGLENVIKKGDIVLIKPNLCVQTENYGSPMTTDYRVVQQVINTAIECGASKIVIAEGNFGSNAFENKGNRYAALKGADLFNFNDCEKEDCYELKPAQGLVWKAIFIPKIYMDADVVINVAKLKTHYITGVSLGLKNCIGIPSYKIYGSGGSKTGLHSLGLEEAIIDLNKIRKPEFTIIDGIIGGENYGPYANTPIHSNIIIAGKDIVSVDAVALTFMGFKVEDIAHVKRAAEEKLGISDLNKIKINGADLNSIAMHFKPAF